MDAVMFIIMYLSKKIFISYYYKQLQQTVLSDEVNTAINDDWNIVTCQRLT